MSTNETIILTRAEVASLLSYEECISAVEDAFTSYARGTAPAPGVLSMHADEGAFHIKAGMMQFDRKYFVAKSNGNFPQNAVRHGLPTIQGVVIVCDAEDGRLLCVMDSIELSILRTGAATAVATKYLSRDDSKVATIWGCGNQGKISARMISIIRPLEKMFLYDINPSAAQSLAKELNDLNLELIVSNDPRQAVAMSDICVTCTTSTKPLLGPGDLKPGTFLAAVGTDSQHKHELHPDLLKSTKVVVDLINQAASFGDLYHAIQAGVMTTDDVHAELGEVLIRKKARRTNDQEVIIFDSTGMALQDVAASTIVYKKALQEKRGSRVNFGS